MEDGLEQSIRTLTLHRILIFGAKGWIGQKVVNLLRTNSSISVFCAEARADDADAVKAEIIKFSIMTKHILSVTKPLDSKNPMSLISSVHLIRLLRDTPTALCAVYPC